MKRRTYRWQLVSDGQTIADGERYARRTAREAGEAALRELCRSAGIYAHRIEGNTWRGTDGRPFAITIEEATP